MGVMLSAAGSLRLGCATRWPRGCGSRSCWPAATVAAGRRGPDLPALPRRRADAARRPRRPRSVRRPGAAPRPGGADPSGARGGRVRAARLPGADRRSSACRPRSGGCRAAARAASCGCRSSPRRSSCRSSGSRSTRARRMGPRCSAGSRPASAPIHAAAAATVQTGETIEPVAEWVEPYREARERFRGLYPALRSTGERPDRDAP